MPIARSSCPVPNLQRDHWLDSKRPDTLRRQREIGHESSSTATFLSHVSQGQDPEYGLVAILQRNPSKEDGCSETSQDFSGAPLGRFDVDETDARNGQLRLPGRTTGVSSVHGGTNPEVVLILEAMTGDGTAYAAGFSPKALTPPARGRVGGTAVASRSAPARFRRPGHC